MSISNDMPHMSDEEAYRLIGEGVAASADQAFRPGDAFYISLGRKWIETHFQLLKEMICKDARVGKLDASPYADAVAILIDIMEHNLLHISPAPPAAVALLCFRLSMHKLCFGESADDNR